LEEKYNKHIVSLRIYTNGSKKDEKVGCGVITPDEKFRKRLKPQNTVFSAEQETIIKAIYLTQRTGEQRLIITDSFSTLMAAEGDINSKNPNTLSLRKLLDEEREKVTILWVPGHMEIPGNEIVEAKKQKLPWKTTS
jgi:ribonuclease HI